MPDQLLTSDPYRTEPGRRGRTWCGLLYAAVLLVCLGITIAAVVIVSPSAGAAGGCGGG